MRRSNRPLRRQASLALVVCLAIALGCLALKWLVLGNIPHGSDAISYHFQARLFAAGRIHSPPAPLPEFFEMAMIAVRPDASRFSVYPPGWPALLALAMLMGCGPLANALMSGVCAFFIWLIATELFGREEGWIALALAALSPFFMFMGASYTAHMSCAAALAATLFFLLRSLKSPSMRCALLWGLASGAAAGMAMLIRPYSAFLGTIGAVWICACAVSWQPRRWIASVVGASVLGALAILAIFAYNKALTGDSQLLAYHCVFPEKNFLGFRGTENPSVWHNVARNLPLAIRSVSKETWGVVSP